MQAQQKPLAVEGGWRSVPIPELIVGVLPVTQGFFSECPTNGERGENAGEDVYKELKVHITSLKRKSGQQSSHQRCTPVHHKSNSTDHSSWERPQDSRSYGSPYLQGHCLVVMIKEGCRGGGVKMAEE